MSFPLGEGHFDGIKVGTGGRQEQDPRASCPDRRLGGFALVSRQIIHHHDIAFGEGWGELFFDVSLEDAPVQGGIDDERGGEPAAAQAGDKGLGHPMPEGCLRTEPLAPRAAAAQTGHLGCGSGLVDEDEPMRFKPHVRLTWGGPFRARRFDVGAVLRARRKGFLKR
jgi:hypothetical protein